MSHERQVVYAIEFARNLKKLRKKYPHVESDIKTLVERLEEGEIIGNRLQQTGDYEVYKARIASTDMKRGKSGGFRVLYYLQTEIYTIVLTIYAKTEQEDISANEVLEIITEALQEIDEDSDNSLNS